MTTAIYLRVSTDAQDTESQRHALNQWVEENAEGSVEWFEDKGISGAVVSRPAWDELRARIEAGEVDRVVVFRKDRVGRDMVERLRIMAEFCAFGVTLVSLMESTDLDSLEGILMECMAAYVAAKERQAIGERIRAGIAKAKGTGGKYDRARAARRKLTARQEKALVRARESGMSFGQLGGKFGVTPSTAMRIFKRLSEGSKHTQQENRRART